MKIHADFECGNIRVLNVEGNHVYLQNELRGTTRDYFYWAFCVEGAQGQTLSFHLDKEWVGNYGAAVSHDLIHWQWMDSRDDGFSFTYRFGEDEDKVYFAHDLVYTPARLRAVLCELGLSAESLCLTPKGREVPLLRIGNGSRPIVLASRHHSCESPGTYVLEGVLREYLASPIEDTSLFVVPFADYDGVCDGDQGKGRAPFDHNRDYTDAPIYPEVREIIRFAKENPVYMGFDFHAPGHSGGARCGKIFVVRKFAEKEPLFDTFGQLFEAACGEDAVKYFVSGDIHPNVGWNKDATPTFSTFFNTLEGCRFACTLENTFFGTAENKVTAEKLVNTGRAFCRAVRKFAEQLES
ncbi:MAG: hypothetical protein IJW99_05935 [Clostridia bacterium]|nr:hypothetical protein [Clostridia bacterium]